MNHKPLISYIISFLLSVALTLTAFFVVIRPGFFHAGSSMIVGIILALALLQFLVQLFFFLHLGRESKPRWNLIAFISTLSVVLIVVIGSLWIMNHLNYNMTPSDMNAYIMKDEGMQR